MYASLQIMAVLTIYNEWWALNSFRQLTYSQTDRKSLRGILYLAKGNCKRKTFSVRCDVFVTVPLYLWWNNLKVQLYGTGLVNFSVMTWVSCRLHKLRKSPYFRKICWMISLLLLYTAREVLWNEWLQTHFRPRSNLTHNSQMSYASFERVEVASCTFFTLYPSQDNRYNWIAVRNWKHAMLPNIRSCLSFPWTMHAMLLGPEWEGWCEFSPPSQNASGPFEWCQDKTQKPFQNAHSQKNASDCKE